jgi:hypothetical protein
VTLQDGPPPGSEAVPAEPLATRSPSPTSSSSTGGGRVRYSGGGAPMGAQALAAAAAAPAAVAAENGAANGAQAAPVVQQRHTDANEPGRNDPCWCGSGKKYKKCHGA